MPRNLKWKFTTKLFHSVHIPLTDENPNICTHSIASPHAAPNWATVGRAEERIFSQLICYLANMVQHLHNQLNEIKYVYMPNENENENVNELDLMWWVVLDEPYNDGFVEFHLGAIAIIGIIKCIKSAQPVSRPQPTNRPRPSSTHHIITFYSHL